MITAINHIHYNVRTMPKHIWTQLKAHQEYQFKHYFLLLCKTEERLRDGMQLATKTFKERQHNFDVVTHYGEVRKIQEIQKIKYENLDENLFDIQHFIVLMSDTMWKRTVGYKTYGTKSQLLHKAHTFAELSKNAMPETLQLQPQTNIVHNGENKEIQSDDGTYFGQLNASGLYHGYGEFTYKNNSVYKGVWNNGQKDIFGYETHGNHENYIGQYKNGLRHGLGKHTYYHKSYEGEYKNNYPDGYGIYVGNSNTTTGNFLEGKRHGFCKVFYPLTNTTFEGEFNTDIATQGKIYYVNGGIYTGDVMFIGVTKLITFDIQSIGQVKAHGMGTFIDKNGNMYKGRFELGKIQLIL